MCFSLRTAVRDSGRTAVFAAAVYRKNLPVIALNLGNLDSTTAAECLNEKGIAVRAGFHCAALAHRKMHTDRDGVVRISLGAFNTRAQAEACGAAVRAILS